MINLCYPTLTRYDLLSQSVESAIKGSLRPDTITVVDNGGKFRDNFGDTKDVDGVPLKVYVPGINIGVGRAWNYFFNTLDDDIVICNDDTVFHENTLELLMRANQNNPKEIFFTPDNYWEHFFSLYNLRKRAWIELGEFDNNFKYYFEDRCMLYRMKLKGYKPFVVKNCHYTHYEGGSNTGKSNDIDKIEFNKTFTQMGQYYMIKYGGLPEAETYSKFFNLLG